MLDRRLRTQVATVLAPVVNSPVRRVPPSTISVIGLLVGLGAAAAAGLQLWPLAFGGWVLNRLLDGLDGEVARSGGAVSDTGAYLDIVFDVVVYTSLPIGMAVGVDSSAVWTATALLLGSFYVNSVSWLFLSALFEKGDVGAQAREEQTSITMPPGLVEGGETVVWFGLMLAVPSLMVWWMGSMALMVVVGAGIRVRQGLAALEAAT